MIFSKTIRMTIVFLYCLNFLFLYSERPDLTIVGFVLPNDGIGKVAINIHECLGKEISKNFICTPLQPKNLSADLPENIIATLNSKNKEPGKVALLTDLLNSYSYLPKSSIIKLAYTMLETTQIPKKWVNILNNYFDAAIVPDQYVLNIYQNSGVTIPIFVLPIPMILSPFLKRPLHGEETSKPFIFGDASATKNPSVLIEAFAETFGNNPNVQLILRAVNIFKEKLIVIENLIAKYQLSNVKIENGGIFQEDYINRLSSFDCYINLSRGEGFSFIPREALALGVPVIISNNTASTTICNSGYVYAVPSNIRVPASKHYEILFREKCGEQFDCNVEDVATAMKEVYYNYPFYVKKANQGRDWVKQYDIDNPNLREMFQTLIKPEKIIFGNENIIIDKTIITNSVALINKYNSL